MMSAVLGALLLLLCRTGADGGAEEFDVKPGGLDYTVTRSWGSFSCSFSYAAQGGTNEKWQMSIEVDDASGSFSCLIWRPSGTSYLYFMRFKAEVSGGKIESCEAFSQADKPLKKSEYEIKDTSVAAVPGGFSSSLSMLKIVVKKTHGEL
ncbi:myeloid-derived growth factor [Eleutherodactylus coqui]|uniref:Myeloid-derived growth factor n=1 Tax=Eleutherodactylus coqui TaxID=57060 RepID=A0A8J6F398_ELECQ|nr:hypothetical protein GDO78_012259 [Eleutherodactylus coqui]